MFNACQAHHKSHDTIEVDTILGKMTVWDEAKYAGQAGLYCTGQDVLSAVLRDEGCWEKRLYDSPVREILEQGDQNNLVIDVGAHLGWYSRMAENMGYEVIAFEGDYENVGLIHKNAPKAIGIHYWFDENSDSFFDPEKSIELLKIDIEGAEQHAIRFFWLMLPKTNNILLEVSPVFNDSYPELLNRLKGQFDIFEHTGEPFNFDFNFSQKDLWLRKKI